MTTDATKHVPAPTEETVDVEAAVVQARKFIAERGELDLPSHNATSRLFAAALLKLHAEKSR